MADRYKTVKFRQADYELLARLTELRTVQRGTVITVPAAVTEAVKIVLDSIAAEMVAQ